MADRLSSSVIFNPTTCGTTVNTPACPFSAAGSGVTIGNEATINGLELTVEAQPLPQLSVGAYIDIKNGKWDRYLNSGSSRYGSNGVRSLTGDAVSFDGNKLARVPDMTMSVNGTWRFGAVSGWAPSLRADLTYYGKYYETDFNFTKTDPWTRLDLRLGMVAEISGSADFVADGAASADTDAGADCSAGPGSNVDADGSGDPHPIPHPSR